MNTYRINAIEITLRGSIDIDAESSEDALEKFNRGDFDYEPMQMEMSDWDTTAKPRLLNANGEYVK